MPSTEPGREAVVKRRPAYYQERDDEKYQREPDVGLNHGTRGTCSSRA
jgi:hypothetical protein